MPKKPILNVIMLCVLGISIAFNIFYIIRGRTLDDQFKKKITCARIRPQVRAEIDEANIETKVLVATGTMGELFYSPKANSCLFVLSATSIFDGSVTTRFLLKDALTGEAIYTRDTKGKDNVFGSTVQREFDDYIAQYK